MEKINNVERQFAFEPGEKKSGPTGFLFYVAVNEDSGYIPIFHVRKRANLEAEKELASVIKLIGIRDKASFDAFCVANRDVLSARCGELYGKLETEKTIYFFKTVHDMDGYTIAAYAKAWAKAYMLKEEKAIRFVGADYKDLFYLKNNGFLRIHYAWGETVEQKCEYIDAYHVKIGGTVFHICQFAEVMSKNGHTYEPAE